jgi:hypothetical protein
MGSGRFRIKKTMMNVAPWPGCKKAMGFIRPWPLSSIILFFRSFSGSGRNGRKQKAQQAQENNQRKEIYTREKLFHSWIT